MYDGDDDAWLFEEDPVPSSDHHGMDAWRFGAAVAAAGAAFDIVPPTWAQPRTGPVPPQPPLHSVNEQRLTQPSMAVEADALLTEGVTDWDSFVGQERIVNAMRADLAPRADVAAEVQPWGTPSGIDHLFVGPVGSGRRTLALLLAKYCGRTIVVHDIPRTPEDFRATALAMGDREILYVRALSWLQMTRRGRDYLWDVAVDFSLEENGRTAPRSDFMLVAGAVSTKSIPDEILEQFSQRIYELEPYSESERLLIAVRCSQELGIGLTAETLTEIALLCDLPGSVRDLVMKCGRWQGDSGRTCSPADLPEVKRTSY